MKVSAKVKQYYSKIDTNGAVTSSKPSKIYAMYQPLKWTFSHGGKINRCSHLKLHLIHLVFYLLCTIHSDIHLSTFSLTHLILLVVSTSTTIYFSLFIFLSKIFLPSTLLFNFQVLLPAYFISQTTCSLPSMVVTNYLLSSIHGRRRTQQSKQLQNSIGRRQIFSALTRNKPPDITVVRRTRNPPYPLS
jgi:hypothetical protein